MLDHYCADILTKPEIIGCALIFMGIILYITDKKAKSKVKYEEMSFKQTFLIGLSQSLAFIPGAVSYTHLGNPIINGIVYDEECPQNCNR